MEYDSVHECDAMIAKKRYLVMSVPTIRRRRRKDGGGIVLELRERAGDLDSVDTLIGYCPYCGVNLMEAGDGID